VLGRKLAFAGVVALGLSGALVVQTADPARAGDFPGYVTDYMLALPGEELYAQNTAAAKAAWQGNMDAFASRSAAAYSAAAIMGNVTPDRIAGVVPINSVRNPDLPGTRWDRFKSGLKLAVPFTGAQPGYKPKVGVGGAVMAATAFAFRAEISDGVVGLFGMDATSAVCGDPATRDGFLNFITGQDCTMYKQSQAMAEEINADVIPGFRGQKVCNAATDRCIELVGTYEWVRPSDLAERLYYCVVTTAQSTGAVVVDNGTSFWYQSTADPGVWVRASGAATSTKPVWQSVQLPSDVENGGGANCWHKGYFDPATMTVAQGLYFTQDSPATITRYWTAPASTPPGSATSGAGVVAVEDDPLRYIECRIAWSTGAVTAAQTETFRESEGEFPEPNCPTAPAAGATPDRITLTVKGEGLDPYIYFDQEATPEYEAFMAEHAECLEYACFLDVVQVETGLSCFSPTITDSCRDWFTDPDRDTKYKCQYGGKDKPMQSCYVYANVFNADKRAQGLAYVDPLTGEEVPGAVTSVRADEYAMGNPIRPGGAGEVRNCWGGTATWSPIDWVLRPIQCAAEWAFVPRASVLQEAQQEIQASFDDTPPGQIIAVVSAWSFNPVMTGCKIEFEHWETHQTLPVVDACPGSFLAPVADIARKVSVVVAIVMSTSLIRRQIAGTVDYRGN